MQRGAVRTTVSHPSMSEAMSQRRTTVVVEDLRCPCCADDVLEAVRAFEGVRAAELDFQRAELKVDHDPALIDDEAIRRSVRSCGYRAAGDPAVTTTGRLA